MAEKWNVLLQECSLVKNWVCGIQAHPEYPTLQRWHLVLVQGILFNRPDTLFKIIPDNSNSIRRVTRYTYIFYIHIGHNFCKCSISCFAMCLYIKLCGPPHLNLPVFYIYLFVSPCLKASLISMILKISFWITPFFIYPCL